jgi:D-arabinose 1-dehydrogenase-like Zn-dependent alcohol dehydrogenase
MKKILFILAIGFVFSSCNKCKECTQEGNEYTSWDGNGNYETHGAYIEEVCSDNFESKADFNDFIEAIENQGYECKSDFWN